MSNSQNYKSWRKVYNYLLELGAGNFALSLPINQLEDNLDFLSGSLNMLAEELSTLIHGIDPEKSYLHPVIINIQIDENMKILDMGQISSNKLNYSFSEFSGQHIHSIISPPLHKKFDEEFSNFKKSEGFTSIPFDLDLITSEGFLLRTKCQFEKLSAQSYQYLILCTKILAHNEMLEKDQRLKAISNFQRRKYPTKTRIKLYKDRLETLNKLHDFIVARLHTNLPAMDEIASEIGASKSKLKVAFKKKYEMTIYAYHRERRLKKAVLLLRRTEKTVETISRECGFTNRSHFSTLFKARFGFRPTDLRKS